MKKKALITALVLALLLALAACGSGEAPETAPAPEAAPPVQTDAAGSDGAEAPGRDLRPVYIAVISLAAVAAAGAAAVMLRRSRDAKKAKAGPEKKPAAAHAIRVGKVHGQGARQSQQDSFFVSDEGEYDHLGVLAAVADGMGGLADGDRVSQEAVRAIMSRFYEGAPARENPQTTLLRLLHAANGAVNGLLGYNVGRSGTTLLLGLARASRFYFLSVGDSRICLMRGGELRQLNREHVYRRELELRAVNGEGTFEEAASHARAAGLTSYLGMGMLKHVDMPDEPALLRPGDRVILMSDGVYNALSGSEISAALAARPAPEAAAELGRMIGEKALPGQDNFTAVILEMT